MAKPERAGRCFFCVRFVDKWMKKQAKYVKLLNLHKNIVEAVYKGINIHFGLSTIHMKKWIFMSEIELYTELSTLSTMKRNE